MSMDMTYFDDTKGEKYIPYVIEPSLGADRVVLAFLCAAYDEENIGTEEKPDVRTVFCTPGSLPAATAARSSSALKTPIRAVWWRAPPM